MEHRAKVDTKMNRDRTYNLFNSCHNLASENHPENLNCDLYTRSLNGWLTLTVQTIISGFSISHFAF